MVRAVLLDTGPLGIAVHPSPRAGFGEWLLALRAHGTNIVIPEIADYELRRALLRINSQRSLERLDLLISTSGYAQITTAIMRQAASLWADARRQGQPTAPDHRLDGDVILAATAQELIQSGLEVTLATDNVRHISRYVPAAPWTDIKP